MTENTKTTPEDRLAQARQQLEQVNQAHILTGWDQLDTPQREQLLDQIQSIDWPECAKLVKTHVLKKPDNVLPQDLTPADWYPRLPGKKHKDLYKQARKTGEKLLRQGKVAAFTVAGGQGTRLGWQGPKGSFPATAIRKIPLFCCMAEFIRKAEKKYETTIPWYVMTSPINDAQTRAFFEKHGNFGLRPDNIMIFPQGMMPAFDPQTGRALLQSPDSIAMSPNGHGGSLKALYTSGAIADMHKRGIEHISYVQIDNPLVKVIDPLFLGLHVLDNSQMSSKALAKAYPDEKVGVFCMVNGKCCVVEYSNLPDELAHQRDAQGQLRFKAGSIAIHLLRVDFVETLNTQAQGFALPYNRADKKVPFWDFQTQRLVEPSQPNAVKLETFVFDALPLCERSIVLETDRIEEFAPIKNADTPDARDCLTTSIQGQTERAARWLEACQVTIPRNAQNQVDAVIEISAMTAIDPQDLKQLDLPRQIDAGTEVLL